MRFRTRRPSIQPRFDVTPLVDILFILSIFFILNAKLEDSRGLKLQLPKAQTGTFQGPPSLLIELTRDSRLFFEQNATTPNELRVLLNAQDRDQRLTLRADQGVPYGRVVDIFDLARELGFQKILLDSKPKVE